VAIPERLLDGIQRLDPLPITVQKLMMALEDENVRFREIATIIEHDGAVAANILKVSNSAAYGGSFRADSIGAAVIRLGAANLLNIILGEHLMSLRPAAPMYSLTENDFWLHSAASSIAVRALEVETKANVIPKNAQIAALLHDIGKLLIVRYFKMDTANILALAEQKRITFVDAERELLGCDHTEVGAEMASRWNFPEDITHAIRHHHNIQAEDANPLIDVVMLANLAAKSLGAGLGADGMNFSIDYARSRERLGLTVKDFERACARALTWLRELRGLREGNGTRSKPPA
jgi:putative nucleotidyltransferase with HDIG domain